MKIAIIGFGKMGSWLAGALAGENEIAVYDLQKSKLENLKGAKVFEKLEDMPSFSPDLVINAVSLPETIPVFKALLGHIPAKCAICDIASVKTGLAGFYKSAGREFVSLHPMFGPTNVNMGLPRGENAIIIKESCEKFREFFRNFFSRLELNIFEYTFEEHDQMMAYSLTTPFITSLTFASCVDKTKVPGTNFSRHIAIARGLLREDDSLLTEILFNQYSIAQISRITSRMELLKHIIDARDKTEAAKFFSKIRNNIG